MKEIKWCSDNWIDESWKQPAPVDYSEYKQYILEHVSFNKVLRDLKLKPVECSTGKYTHKMTCPFKFHKNGRERTSSFRFHDKKNTFVCYGCTESGDILKFLQLYYGGGEQYHLEKLAKMFGLMKDDQIQLPENYVEVIHDMTPHENNTEILFSIGIMLRQYLKTYNDTKLYEKECKWVDKMFVKADEYFKTIEIDNMVAAKDIYAGVENAINKRKKNNK